MLQCEDLLTILLLCYIIYIQYTFYIIYILSPPTAGTPILSCLLNFSTKFELSQIILSAVYCFLAKNLVRMDLIWSPTEVEIDFLIHLR